MYRDWGTAQPRRSCIHPSTGVTTSGGVRTSDPITISKNRLWRLSSVPTDTCSDYNWLGYGRFGVNPGTNGNQYNVAFDVGASGLGVLAADPDFYYQTFAGMSFYYNPAHSLLYLSASEANAKSIGAGLVKVCLEMVDENDTSPPSACAAAQPVKRQLWAEYVDGSGGGWVGYDSDVGGLKWSIPSVSNPWPRAFGPLMLAVPYRDQDVLCPDDYRVKCKQRVDHRHRL